VWKTQTDPGLDDAISFARKTFGFSQFRPGQRDTLAAVLEGSDVLVIMPTGGGKSLCYQIPAFIRQGLTLVVSPLIALMKDQVDTLRVLDLPAASLHSLMPLSEQERVLLAMKSGEVKLLYVSPERLRNPRFFEALQKAQISMVAVDEAHCISQWGHDFRPDYLKIKDALHGLGRPQVLALTATAPERVRTDILQHLQLRSPRLFVSGFDRRNLFWEVIPVSGDAEKREVIRTRVTGTRGAVVIYTGTRRNVDRLVGELREDGFAAQGYHAGMDQEMRNRVQETFMEGRCDLVVATNAFGMGIDRSDIRLVIHHTFPGSIEAYYQEGGRAGRDGEPAACLLLYSPNDRRLQEFFIQARYPEKATIREVYARLLKRGEEVLWLTYRQIGRMGEETIPEMAVGSGIKILEDAGVVKRLQRYDNLAELYLKDKPARLLQDLSPRARNRRTLLEHLLAARAEEEDGIRFVPAELAEASGLSRDALRNALAQMEAEGQACYIPPFRGRGVRILKRLDPRALPVDYDALRIRQAYELTRLDQVMAYAESAGCRRKFLLRYFGETMEKDRCGACDTCVASPSAGVVTPPESSAHADTALKILSCAARLKGRFGVGMIAKILAGSRSQTLLRFGLDRLSTYGLLKEEGQTRTETWVRELVSGGYLEIHRVPMGDKIYPVVRVTSKGHEAMRRREPVPLSRPPSTLPPAREASPPDPAPSEGEVFRHLRELRLRLARREGLPAYCIFHDRTLREIARSMPSTKEELSGIVGIGEATLRKYGNACLELLEEIRSEKGQGAS